MFRANCRSQLLTLYCVPSVNQDLSLRSTEILRIALRFLMKTFPQICHKYQTAGHLVF